MEKELSVITSQYFMEVFKSLCNFNNSSIQLFTGSTFNDLTCRKTQTILNNRSWNEQSNKLRMMRILLYEGVFPSPSSPLLPFNPFCSLILLTVSHYLHLPSCSSRSPSLFSLQQHVQSGNFLVSLWAAHGSNWIA